MGLMRTVLATLWIMSSSQLLAQTRLYENSLTRVDDPRPILAQAPGFVDPIDEPVRFRSPILIDDAGADLAVDAWRFNYNARGVIEIPNRLDGKRTAIIVVHPWGIDDGSGWRTPEPAGVAFGCTPAKNKRMLEHAEAILAPFIERLRPHVGLVIYSLPGVEDAVRGKIYRSVRRQPSAKERQQGEQELRDVLGAFTYVGAEMPTSFAVDARRPTLGYFKSFPGLEAYQHANPKGFWDLPIPVMKPIDVAPTDVVFYDQEGYELLHDFLNDQGIDHVLLCGYHADMCVCSTTAGHENLRKDFDVIMVGDAVQASLPANATAARSTNHAVSSAALHILITETSWIRPLESQASRSSR